MLKGVALGMLLSWRKLRSTFSSGFSKFHVSWLALSRVLHPNIVCVMDRVEETDAPQPVYRTFCLELFFDDLTISGLTFCCLLVFLCVLLKLPTARSIEFVVPFSLLFSLILLSTALAKLPTARTMEKVVPVTLLYTEQSLKTVQCGHFCTIQKSHTAGHLGGAIALPST